MIMNMINIQIIPKTFAFFLSCTTAKVVGTNSSSEITICFFLANLIIPFHSTLNYTIISRYKQEKIKNKKYLIEFNFISI